MIFILNIYVSDGTLLDDFWRVVSKSGWQLLLYILLGLSSLLYVIGGRIRFKFKSIYLTHYTSLLMNYIF